MINEDSELLADCAAAVLGRHDPDAWQHVLDDSWHYVVPLGHQRRKQGWKLHVPATPLSACVVLSRCVAVLAEQRCAFKFAKTMRALQLLIEPNIDRGSAGKFLTAYPDDDEHAVRVAQALHEVTLGLPGQSILSDRRFRVGSQVFYRYGGFTPDLVLNDDGEYVGVLYDGNQKPVKDRRTVGRPAPDWVTDPFQPVQPPARRAPESVLIAGRFRVRKAIRQSNRGGVYVATDEESDAQVILKRFRKHTAAALNETDSRNRARAEARLLSALGPAGVSPRFLGLFNEDGDMFVATEQITGVPLRRYVTRNLRPVAGDGLAMDTAVVLDFARQLVELLSEVHKIGYVLGDLTPNNVMVTEQGKLVLIDLESGLRSWEVAARLATKGYAAPEEVNRERLVAPAPGVPVDLYGLGATLMYLASGVHPPSGSGSRVREMVSLMATRNPAVRVVSALVTGLLADDPDERPTLAAVLAELREPSMPAPAVAVQPAADELIDGMLAALRTTMTPDEPWLWRPSAVGQRYDPCSAQVGAAGVLSVLCQAVRAGVCSESTVDTAARWLAKRIEDEPKVLPGLMFGRAGTAVALVEAGLLVDDRAITDAGFALARRLPTRGPVPDVFHGVAGAGIALLRLWKISGDTEFLERARDCADGLLDCMRVDGDLVSWTATGDFVLAGKTHWGFAHGVAGIGTFLLDAAQATGEQRWLQVARQCGHTVASVADREGSAAFWPTGEEDEHADSVRMTGLCSGSSGAGTFLLRLFQATEDKAAAELAEAAACAVRCANWTALPVWCHGLASDGDFLLDCVEILDQSRYREWAEQTAEVIAARTVPVAGQLLTPDEGGEVAASYGNGFAGPLSFLLRLRHGGPRPFFGQPVTS